ncbi:hypothetical protein EVG20_g4835 [Dentipellis fragilis]|uniref:Uncharacterized protein n=1 Tax=Dentipellis fragilis TaxID=205917 RepID=A0A4Y9YVL5_9AGAM|nr:hypothetical protein EVG20_g4835 [Dentipellis fragilis]
MSTQHSPSSSSSEFQTFDNTLEKLKIPLLRVFHDHLTSVSQELHFCKIMPPDAADELTPELLAEFNSKAQDMLKSARFLEKLLLWEVPTVSSLLDSLRDMHAQSKLSELEVIFHSTKAQVEQIRIESIPLRKDWAESLQSLRLYVNHYESSASDDIKRRITEGISQVIDFYADDGSLSHVELSARHLMLSAWPESKVPANEGLQSSRKESKLRSIWLQRIEVHVVNLAVRYPQLDRATLLHCKIQSQDFTPYKNLTILHVDLTTAEQLLLESSEHGDNSERRGRTTIFPKLEHLRLDLEIYTPSMGYSGYQEGSRAQQLLRGLQDYRLKQLDLFNVELTPPATNGGFCLDIFLRDISERFKELSVLDLSLICPIPKEDPLNTHITALLALGENKWSRLDNLDNSDEFEHLRLQRYRASDEGRTGE